MRSLVPGSLTGVLLACLALLLGSTARALWAQTPSVCHDGNWDDAEFCGRDAYLVTGETEMNHDCFVDLLDLRLFAPEFALMGPNLSADLDGNGMVDLLDLLMLRSSYALPVSPCTRRGTLPDLCEGTIALSFSSNPATIVSTQAQAPGQHRVYVVVDGWTNPEIIEYAVETSSNITIVDHPPTSYPHWTNAAIQLPCDPDAQHSWRGFISVTGSWPAGPIAYNFIDYQLSDANPAWIQLVPVPSCWANSRIRWAQGAADRSRDFWTVLNAGINGTAPAGQSTCRTGQIPALDARLLWALAAILLALAVVALARRARAPA